MMDVIRNRGTNGQFEVVPVHSGELSSKFSINGTTPESKSGTRLCYVNMLDFDHEKGVLDSELWVCNRELTDNKKVIDVRAGRHNGIEASWVDDHRIAYVSREGKGGHMIYVVDADRSEVLFGPIYGALCHDSQQHLIAFGVTPELIRENKNYPQINTAGIYTLDCDTGEIRLVIRTEKLLDFFKKNGLSLTEKPYGTSHIQLNPSATRIMSMWSSQEYRVIASWDMNGEDIRIVHKKPVHQIWYDDASYIATYDDKTDPERRLGKQQMYRYSLDGERLEYLAGLGNHVDGSPDREWYVTDSLNFHDPISIHLYKKGNHEPFALLDSHRYTELVWNTKVHSNPAFSRDGSRVYYTRPVNHTMVKACYIDISEIISD